MKSAARTVREYLGKRGVNAFVKVVPAGNTWAGAAQLLNAYGFGPITPNTFMLGETENPAHYLAYAGLTRRIHDTRRNLVIVRECEETTEPVELDEGSRIDVWWRGQQHNIGFLITLAYLMKQSDGWSAAELLVKTIVDPGEDRDATAEHMRDYLKRQRIEAEVEVMVKDRPDVFDIIRVSSEGASLVLFGMRPPREDESDEEYAKNYEYMLSRTRGLPPTAIALAAQNIEFHHLFDPG
jgi:hypothetical protein